MKTVSTLCATSTVGIAVCGYALARPYTGNDLNDHLTNSPIHTNSFIPPLIRKTTASCPNGNGFRDIDIEASRQEEKRFPSLPTNFSRPSTSRKWLRRLSESFSSSSSSGTTSPTTSTASSTPSSSRSQSTSIPASAPNSRPPTRNKLHRQRLSASPTVPSPLRRPSTAIHQSPPAGKSSHLTPIHASRPSTSAPESSPPPRLLTQEPVASWRVFFSAKHQKARSSSAAGGKLTKLAGIRRIYPNRSRQDLAPTLVLAPALEASEENDTGSLFSAAESLFIDSRPGTRMDNHHPPSLRRPSTSVPPPPKRRVQRSFSISNILTAPDSRKPSQGDTDAEEREGRSCFAETYSMDLEGVARRFSESSPNPNLPDSTPPSPMPVGGGEQLPPIQSLSSLELDVVAVPATSSPDTEDRRLEALSPVDPAFEAEPDMDVGDGGNRDLGQFSQHQHRLSIVSASERASTLVGSEDLNHFENDLDFQSDTVFDSMRTRVSELTPVRADAIFHLPPEPSDYPLPMGSGQSLKSCLGSDFTPARPSSPTPTSLTPQFQGSRISFDDDDDAWSSDWDLPSKSNDGAGDLRVSPAGGLRPFSGLLSSHLGLNSHSNASNSSFGTAPEGFSVDGSSVRETSSILEWSESIPANSTPVILARRSKTMHAKESLLAATRVGRRAPSYHIRSQSMPVANTVQRVPLPSENWDEDFLDDDEDDGFGMPRNEMVIPRAIEERQASVIGHLGCVREFALLVEDLKRLRDKATCLGSRNGIHKHLWEEADGIIALATLDDEDTIPSTHNDKMQHRSSWHSPSRHSEMTAEDDNQARSTPRNRRQSSILLPDDDVFGGNIPATPPFPHLRHNLRNPPSSSSPSPLSRKVIDKNDPVEVAKGIMERMQLQHRQRSDHVISAGMAKASLAGGAYQFDTDMLRELVVHVGGLKRDLAELVDCCDSPSPSLRKHAHYMPSPDLVDSPTTLEASDHGLDISPVKTSFDQECCGSGLERARSNNGVDFRPIVGVV